MRYMVIIEKPTYQELSDIYSKYFSLGYLNTDTGSKFALISLTCFLTRQARLKNPDATPYQVLMKIIGDTPENKSWEFVKSISIICDDFMKQTSDFLTFEMSTSRDMVLKIREILNAYLPF